MAYISVPIGSILGSLHYIKSPLLNPVTNNEYCASKASIPSFWLVRQPSLDIIRTLWCYAVNLSQTPVPSVEDHRV